jgi:hypothetical protein
VHSEALDDDKLVLYDNQEINNYWYVTSFQSNELPNHVKDDYQWLEKYIPYSKSAEDSVHYFIRFKD